MTAWRRWESNPLLLGASEVFFRKNLVPSLRATATAARRSCDGAEPTNQPGYGPYLRFDEAVAGCQRGCHAVAAVLNDVAVTQPYQPNRRRLATLLEPLPVPLDRWGAEATRRAVAHGDLGERSPGRRCL